MNTIKDAEGKLPHNRQQYMLHTLKLSYDPFRDTAVEKEVDQELQTTTQAYPTFHSYFVPPTGHTGELLLDKLQEASFSVVYGKAGYGKTTLAYMLDAVCRAEAQPTLTVSLPLGKSGQWVEQGDAVWRWLSEALAVDLFVQVVERLHMVPELTAEQTTRLAEFWYRAIPDYGRRLQRHLNQEQKSEVSQTANWWTLWKRPTVRYTPLTPERLAFLQKIQGLEPAQLSLDNHKTLFTEGLQIAKTMGFEQIFLLIDIPSNIGNQIQILQQSLATLIEKTTNNSPPLPIYLKLFLPEEYKTSIDSLIKGYTQLTSPSFFAIMKWQSPDALKSIVERRFHSAGSKIRGFHTIAKQAIAAQLDEKIIHTANQSPRRLLQLATTLIDTHANNNPDDPLISADDWNALCQTWGYGEPLPLPFDNSRDEKGNIDGRQASRKRVVQPAQKVQTGKVYLPVSN